MRAASDGIGQKTEGEGPGAGAVKGPYWAGTPCCGPGPQYGYSYPYTLKGHNMDTATLTRQVLV